MENTTCQICGRTIKSKKGVVAHHGYKRPGNGWQTDSCMGARYLPYELSRTLIPVAIKHVEMFIEGRKDTLAKFVSSPPATLHDSFYKKDIPLYEGFDPSFVLREDYRVESYDTREYNYRYRTVHYNLYTELVQADNDRKYLQERYEGWVQPTEQQVQEFCEQRGLSSGLVVRLMAEKSREETE